MTDVRRFRRRPIVVEALEWTGNNIEDVVAFTGCVRWVPRGQRGDSDVTAEVWDDLHDTWVGVKPGQWVIKGIAGEFYPIDASVLADTYDDVTHESGS